MFLLSPNVIFILYVSLYTELLKEVENHYAHSEAFTYVVLFNTTIVTEKTVKNNPQSLTTLFSEPM